jgi:hypothetical protein
MNTLDTVYVGLIAFAVIMAAIGVFYNPKPKPRPYTTLRDPRAHELNVTPFEQRFGGGR